MRWKRVCCFRSDASPFPPSAVFTLPLDVVEAATVLVVVLVTTTVPASSIRRFLEVCLVTAT